jgi:5-aminopentanamidase
VASRLPLHVAVYQYAARDETPQERLDRLSRLLAKSPDRKLDLVVCPELFASGYEQKARVLEFAETQGRSFEVAAAALAERHNTTLVYGYPEHTGGKRFNSAMIVDPNGDRTNHRKLLLPRVERELFRPGDRYTWFEVAGWRLALLICYDVEFPEAVRACVLDGADLIVVPTALKEEWAVVARHVVPTRAFENGVFLLYANYCGTCNAVTYLGESCVIGPDGSDVARARRSGTLLTGVLVHEQIHDARRRLGYLEDRRSLDTIASARRSLSPEGAQRTRQGSAISCESLNGDCASQLGGASSRTDHSTNLGQ